MPLCTPTVREAIHTRQISCIGYRREDGLWDIEGHFLDTKTHPFRTADDQIVAAGDAIHQMRLRVTIDDALLIRAAEAVTENGPSASCYEIHSSYARLVGLTIGPGFTRRIKELFSGTGGCTHLSELLGPIATTALQTLSHRFKRDEQQRLAAASGKKPALVDSCHTFRADGPVVKRLWPASYSGS